MIARMKIEKPDDVEVTLTVTMSAKKWCELRDQLKSEWPSWELSSAISNMLGNVRKIVWDESEVKS